MLVGEQIKTINTNKMKTLTNRTLYVCDFCGKRFQTKHGCLFHEQHKCNANPDNQHMCLQGCKYLETVEEETTEYTYTGYEYEIKYKTFRCKKHDKKMFTYRLNPKMFLWPLIAGIRMPLDCKDYQVNIHDEYY